MLPHETLVVAHRGAWGELPENTIEAFELAVRLGVDMIELDVRRTGDGHLVVLHDAVGDSRHEEVRAKGASVPPPLLEDVAAQLSGRIALNVELKEPGCVVEVVRILQRHNIADCLITSFLDDVVGEAKTHAPWLRTGLVVGRSSPEDPPTRAQRCNADYLVLELGLEHHAARSPIPCLVWTVNEEATIDRLLADPAVAAVITDRPALALERRSLLSDRTARAERS